MKIQMLCLWAALVSLAACSNPGPQTNLINPDGCTVAALDSLLADSSRVALPNIFTPDGDGFNDRFQPTLFLADTTLSHYSLLIIDQQGQPVFDTNQPDAFWDGTDLSGDFVPSSLYDYNLSFDLGSAAYLFTGQVTLIRPSESEASPEGESFEIQQCPDCVFPDQIDPRNGVVRATGQPLGAVCL